MMMMNAIYIRIAKSAMKDTRTRIGRGEKKFSDLAEIKCIKGKCKKSGSDRLLVEPFERKVRKNACFSSINSFFSCDRMMAVFRSIEDRFEGDYSCRTFYPRQLLG